VSTVFSFPVSPDTNSQNRTATYPHIDYEPMGIWLFDTVVLYPEGDATDHLYATKNEDIDDEVSEMQHH